MIEQRLPGQNTTLETRHEANESVDKQLRYSQIIQILKECNTPLSAKEIAVIMFIKGYARTDERNISAPRLTELLKKGIVDCIGKKKCQYTHKSVGVFGLRKEADTII